MTNTLAELLSQNAQAQHATDTGTRMHAIMQGIVVDGDLIQGDSKIVSVIQSRPDLIPFFNRTSQTEVPVAGFIGNRFISRRIDRLCINHSEHRIDILDYKTDIDCTSLHDEYVAKLGEYVSLLHMIYPKYEIRAYILWLHDWRLEQVR